MERATATESGAVQIKPGKLRLWIAAQLDHRQDMETEGDGPEEEAR